jgi:hypothetical protein
MFFLCVRLFNLPLAISKQVFTQHSDPVPRVVRSGRLRVIAKPYQPPPPPSPPLRHQSRPSGQPVRTVAGVPPPPWSVVALRNPRSRAWCHPPARRLAAAGQGDWWRVPTAALLQEGGGGLLSASHGATSPSGGRYAAVAVGDGSLVVA